MKTLFQPLFRPAALLLTTAGLLAATACSKDEKVVAPTISNEALTTVQLRLTNTADAANVVTAQWEQLNDANGNPQTPDVSQANLSLKPNATYNCVLTLLDKTQSPVFVVSDEIRERANYHHFFYQPLPTTQALVIPAPGGGEQYPAPIPTPLPTGPALNLTATITDQDTNTPALPLGLTTTMTTGAASTGYLRVVLRHQPNVKDGTYAPGSTDLDVGFKVAIQ